MIPITEDAYLAKDNLFRLNLAMRLIGDCTFASHTNTLERNGIFRSIQDFIERLPPLAIVSKETASPPAHPTDDR